ncbi:MAG: Hpt domain-containing protein [Opitutales bacterium]
MDVAPHIENVVYDSSLPVMDVEQIDMLLISDEGDEPNALALELFKLHETESAEKLADLAEICRARDGHALRKIVHFIAGSAGNLGLVRLTALYRGIEQAIDVGRLEDYEACSQVIRREFELSCRRFMEALDFDA